MYRVITTAYEDDDVFCQFEDFESQRFFHVEVHNFSPSRVRAWREAFKDIKKKCIEDGYSELFSYTQNKKFVGMFSRDYEDVAVVEFENKIYEVIKWELKQSC